MVVIVQMVLLPRFRMQGDINYDPEEDWLDDNKGMDQMDYPNFFDAMFELAGKRVSPLMMRVHAPN